MKKAFTILCSLMVAMVAIAQDVTLAGPAGCNGAAVTGTWEVPCNVSAITVDVYGGGGGAGGGGGGSDGGAFNTRGGGGAGGGAYSSITINVTPGSIFTYTIGAGGCGGDGGSDGSSGDAGTAGAGSSFSGTDAGSTAVSLSAGGGARGNGGSGSGNNPGSGGAGGTATGGTTNTDGTAGSNGSGGSGGPGGAGAGPAGGAGGASTNNPGSTYGGGGAGGGNSDGGNGAAGGILITYTTASPLPVAPAIVALPATCSGDGSSTISNYDAAYNYTFNPSGPTVGTGGLVSGMVAGNSYTVVATLGTCPPSDTSAVFSNETQLIAPAVPTVTSTAATCDADGSSVVDNFDMNATYTFTPSGPTANASGLITGAVTGTSYTVQASNGACASAASAAFSNEAQLSGSACDTGTVSINDISGKVVQVRLYPNPTTNQVVIDYSQVDLNKGDATVQVANNLGQIVYSQTLSANSSIQQLETGNMPSGMYTVCIKHNGGIVATGRLVKE